MLCPQKMTMKKISILIPKTMFWTHHHLEYKAYTDYNFYDIFDTILSYGKNNFLQKKYKI